MTYIKLIFLIIMLMLDRCGIITPISRKNIIGIETEKLTPQKLDGSWRLSSVEIKRITLNIVPDSLSQEALKIEKDEDFLLSFFPDSSFTEIKVNGEYITGKWSYKEADQSVSLISKNKTENFKAFLKRGTNGLRLMKLKSASGDSLSLAGFGKSMENYQDDPFYAANNTWREKPLKPESDKQILDRLTKYIAHNAYMLKAADTRRQQFISWEFSKGIIKIYNGGIGLVAQDKIPEIWINSFYSHDDALKAYNIFDHYLRTTSYKGTAKGNWVKDDYDILISIYNGLKKVNV